MAQQFAGSQDSLQSATGEEQDMEEMTGVMDNDMEPLDSTLGVWAASFPGLHAQLLSLAVRKAGSYCKRQKLGVEAWERG